MTRDDILAYAERLARGQLGGTLATVHAEDGTPYVTYVLFHLRPNGEVLFGSAASPQHARNIAATPEVSFLIDNREAVKSDWSVFDRIVIEGRAIQLGPTDAAYEGLLAELAAKDEMAAFFTRRGYLFVIRPRRLILTRGLGGGEAIDFPG